MEDKFAPIYRDLLNELLIMHHFKTEPYLNETYPRKPQVDKLCALITAHNILEIEINSINQ